MFAVIAENDVSQWSDETGVLYHFPKRYAKHLLPGTKVIYYKGKMLDRSFSAARLSPDPHYFGLGTIGHIYPDKRSEKSDLFATIEDFQLFSKALPIKDGAGQYLETIPATQQSNYWRNGVRPLSEPNYLALLSAISGFAPEQDNQPSVAADEEALQSIEEGQPLRVYSTRFERNPALRAQAIAIHGTACIVCKLDFEKTYGELGRGFIHVHHRVPLCEYEGSRKVDPEKDLVPVCPNCHAMLHRKRSLTLSIDELAELFQSHEPISLR